METLSRLCKHAVVLGLAVLVVGLLAVPVFADTTFSDSTFNLSNYTQTTVYNSDPIGTTLTVQQCTSCGNPGLGLQLAATNQNVATSSVGLIGNLFHFNPSTQGTITSIDASVDKDLSINFINQSSTPAGNTFRPLIYQDGVIYMAAIAGPGILTGQDTTGYNNISATGLTAADFLSYSFLTGTFGSANPNFNGDPMYFGLGQVFGSGSPGENLTADYDNFQLTVHTPEPNSLFLLGFGLAALALLARFRH